MDRTTDTLHALLLDPFLTVGEATREAAATAAAARPRRNPPRRPADDLRPAVVLPAPIPHALPARPAFAL